MTVKVRDDGAAVKVDTSNSSNIYVGVAQTASATSAAVWQIRQIVISGAFVTITWADGNQLYDNIWDNRASLSYS